MQVWRERSLRATVVLLATSAVLIGPSLAGVGGSIPLLGLLLATSIFLYALRDQLGRDRWYFGHNLGTYGPDLWLGPLIGIAMLLVINPTASPGEIQAIGGIAGLLGMFNYFARPLYFTIVNFVLRFLSSNDTQNSNRPPARTEENVTTDRDVSDAQREQTVRQAESASRQTAHEYNGGTERSLHGDTESNNTESRADITHEEKLRKDDHNLAGEFEENRRTESSGESIDRTDSSE